jgi:chitodextrinase
VTHATYSGLVPGTPYQFTVRAVAYGAVSAASNLATATPLAPAPPATITAMAADGSVTLNWSASAGASGYDVYMGTAAGAESGTAVKLALSGLTTTITGLTNGTTYYFVVHAEIPTGEGAASKEVSATPVAPAPPPPPPKSGGGGGAQDALSLLLLGLALGWRLRRVRPASGLARQLSARVNCC